MKKNKLNFYLAILAPLLLITPLTTFINNPDDFHISIYLTSLLLGCVWLFSAIVIKKLLEKFKLRKYLFLNVLLVIFSLLVTVQGFFITSFFEYGILNGTKIEWDEFGVSYYLETLILIVAFGVLTWFFSSRHSLLNSLVQFIFLFSLIQLFLAVPKIDWSINKNKQVVDESVFHFSNQQNIIHILADGVQADIVKEVFENNPHLKNKFKGFTFFENHLGKFQGTAPTIPSIFNGEFFNLDNGYIASEVKDSIANNSYVNTLKDKGFQLDFAGISEIYCIEGSNSCENKSFNDLKPRGYEQESSLVTLFLMYDISFFKHFPMMLKKRIYNQGQWLFSASVSKIYSSPPDPIIKEWKNKMVVNTDQPVYKWYHNIGTHIPAMWDQHCKYIGRQPQIREAYYEQTYCVLKSLASFFDKLREEKIYQKSTIIINSDHGCNIKANDLVGESYNSSVYTDQMLGVSRPIFLMKRSSDDINFNYSQAPTTLIDIAPTILDSIGLDTSSYQGISAFANKKNSGVTRSFHRYFDGSFWTGKPINYLSYEVSGSIKDRSNWRFTGFHNLDKAPTSYPKINFGTAFKYSKGLSLYKDTNKIAYTKGNKFYVVINYTNQKELILTLKTKSVGKGIKVNVAADGYLVGSSNLDKSNEWKSLIFPLSTKDLKQGNNTLEIQFEESDGFQNNMKLIKSLTLN